MLLLALAFVSLFWLAILFGAPYLPTRKKQVEAALDILNLKPGQTVADLGSGDGAFLLGAARRGLYAVGYEINPLLYLVSRLRLWRYRKLVRVYARNYWLVPLPEVDAIYVFLIGRYMSKLDVKLRQELRRPAKLASYAFKVPGKKVIRKKAGIFLYQY